MTALSTSTTPAGTDDTAMRTFLIARLVEERASARADQRFVRGLEVLEEVIGQLSRGETPDQMTCDLLVVAYSGHPDFEERWNRWRPGSSGHLGQRTLEGESAIS